MTGDFATQTVGRQILSITFRCKGDLVRSKIDLHRDTFAPMQVRGGRTLRMLLRRTVRKI